MIHSSLLYFDIETVSNYEDLKSFKDSDIRGYELFEKKYKSNKWNDEFPLIDDAYLKYGAFFSTYGKIVCISYGIFTSKNEKGYSIRSLIGDEVSILENFNNIVQTATEKNLLLCGYNILAFDIPFIFRRLIKHDIQPSYILNPLGKKPWELGVVDLLDDWKQKFRYMMSLDEVCYELGIDSPKEDTCGGDVHDLYYKNHISDISNYCEKDVLSTMMIAKKLYK